MFLCKFFLKSDSATRLFSWLNSCSWLVSSSTLFCRNTPLVRRHRVPVKPDRSNNGVVLPSGGPLTPESPLSAPSAPAGVCSAALQGTHTHTHTELSGPSGFCCGHFWSYLPGVVHVLQQQTSCSAPAGRPGQLWSLFSPAGQKKNIQLRSIRREVFDPR